MSATIQKPQDILRLLEIGALIGQRVSPRVTFYDDVGHRLDVYRTWTVESVHHSSSYVGLQLGPVGHRDHRYIRMSPDRFDEFLEIAK